MTERTHRPHNNERRNNNYRRPPYKKPSKGLIMLKSTTIALGIVLLVAASSFAYIKHKKDLAENLNCKNASISTSGRADIIRIEKDFILIKADIENHTEIIKIKNKGKCSKIINRIYGILI